MRPRGATRTLAFVTRPLFALLLLVGCASETTDPAPDPGETPDVEVTDSEPADVTDPPSGEVDRVDPEDLAPPSDPGPEEVDPPSDPGPVDETVDVAEEVDVPPLLETVAAGECGEAVPIGCGEAFLGDTSLQSTGQVLDGTACNEFLYPGTEVVFAFESPGDGKVEFGLDPMGNTLDLLLLAGAPSGCNALDCLAWGPSEGAAATVEAGDTIYAVVDGYLGASGAFEFSVDCSAIEDKPAMCEAAGQLQCFDNLLIKPDDPGEQQQIAAWAACGEHPGPERAYLFAATDAASVTVSATGLGAGSILVLDGAGGCQAYACVASADGELSLTFDAEAGQDYFLVLESGDGFADPASVAVSCR